MAAWYLKAAIVTSDSCCPCPLKAVRVSRRGHTFVHLYHLSPSWQLLCT